MRQQVFVITGDLKVYSALEDALSNGCIGIRHIVSAKEMDNRLNDLRCCLIILDICSHETIAIELLKAAKRGKPIPVLVLGCGLTSAEKAALLHSGADAILDKPISRDVFAEQVHALIRLYVETDPPYKWSRPLAFGTKLIINPHFHVITVDGQLLRLTRKEFDLLYCLASYAGQVMSRGQLYEEVWGEVPEAGADGTVKAHIASLRRKLSQIETKCIQNVWGVGYKFIPPA